MTVKVIKNGFGKRTVKIFKLNTRKYCINLLGIAVFLNF